MRWLSSGLTPSRVGESCLEGWARNISGLGEFSSRRCLVEGCRCHPFKPATVTALRKRANRARPRRGESQWGEPQWGEANLNGADLPRPSLSTALCKTSHIWQASPPGLQRGIRWYQMAAYRRGANKIKRPTMDRRADWPENGLVAARSAWRSASRRGAAVARPELPLLYAIRRKSPDG
jgi:hypothetical protein